MIEQGNASRIQGLLTKDVDMDKVTCRFGGIVLLLLAGLSACGGGGGGGVVQASNSSVASSASTSSAANANSSSSSSSSSSSQAVGACASGTWVVGNSSLPEIQYESAHVAIRANSGVITLAKAKAAAEALETAYAFYTQNAGLPDLACASTVKYKVNVEVSTTSSNPNGGRDSLGLPYIGTDPTTMENKQTMAHELVHVFQVDLGTMLNSAAGDRYYTAWFAESHAVWMSTQVPGLRSEAACTNKPKQVDFPHIYFGSVRTRYCSFTFWEFLKNRYGYQVVSDIWVKGPKSTDSAAATADPFTVLMANQGWSVSQLNDLFGEWAMHNVTWDYTNPDGTDQGAIYKSEFGGYDVNYSSASRMRRTAELYPIDLANRRFAIPSAWAPQRWGYNLIRIIPDTGATSVHVAFRGVFQASPATTSLPGLPNEPASIPAPASGWRWGIVAVDSAGKPRYGDLKSGADEAIDFALQTGDQSVYMIVLGAPTQMQQIKDDQPYYSVYRFPYMLEFGNAMPFGYQADAGVPFSGAKRHANGGGWIGGSAKVDASAYVGPYARVVQGSVLGNARIEDNAVMFGGTVSGNAVLGGMTILAGVNTQVRDSAAIWTVLDTVGADLNTINLSGTARIVGDVAQTDVRNYAAQPFTASQGVFYGLLYSSSATDPGKGANLVSQPAEITATPGYIWR